MSGLELLLLWHYTITKRKLEQKYLFPIIKGNQDRNSSREGFSRDQPMQRPCKGPYYSIVLHVFLIMLSYRIRATSLEVSQPTSHNLSHKSVIKKMTYSVAYNQVLWRYFLNRDFWSKMTSLSQDDIKLDSMLCELLSSMTYAPDLCSSLELSGNITPSLKIYK